LEGELTFVTTRVKDLDRRMEGLRREYERELDSVRKNYESNMTRYQEAERQILVQQNVLRAEREDIERLATLYKTSNENLETINHRLMV
jgi:chromosome segregation ATPase